MTARRSHASAAPWRWSEDHPGWLEGIRHARSPNFDRRPEGMAVDTLIIHYISLPPGVFAGDAAERLFLNQLDTDSDPRLTDLAGLRVSAHFLIRRRGEIIQFVASDDRAWHAGPSRLGERERCNDFSIGIELEGDSLRPFTAAQYRRLDALVNALRTRHPLAWVAGHSDIAPGRKEDPGPMFDWKRVVSGRGFTGLIRPF